MRHAVIAMVQMNSGDCVADNLAAVGDYVRAAAGQGAQLVVLPENFAAMSADESYRRKIAEADGSGPIQDALAELASSARVWLVAGTVPLKLPDESRPAAACCVYADDGRRVARYDKIHLFDVQIPGGDEAYRESRNTAAGRVPVVVDTPVGRLGLSVCYDLRFPELYRRLAEAGAEIFAVPSAFTQRTGEAHWEVLLRARAIENLAYVVAAAQTGEHPGGRITWGHSMLVGPWGDVIAMQDDAPGCILGPVDIARPARLRAEFPSLAHRRFGIQGESVAEITKA
jgi:predicted amidohydrolase